LALISSCLMTLMTSSSQRPRARAQRTEPGGMRTSVCSRRPCPMEEHWLSVGGTLEAGGWSRRATAPPSWTVSHGVELSAQPWRQKRQAWPRPTRSRRRQRVCEAGVNDEENGTRGSANTAGRARYVAAGRCGRGTSDDEPRGQGRCGFVEVQWRRVRENWAG
jgi:hypothetical protein